jgi:hypothetical protein
MGVRFFDQYSILHMSSGVVAYFIGIKLPIWIIIHILFEIIENQPFFIKFNNEYLEWFWPGGKEKPDTFINSMIGDNFFAILGWVVAYSLDKYGKKNKWDIK